MNDKVIALIDMDCFYVQVTEPSDRKRNNCIEGGGKGKALTEGGASCSGSGFDIFLCKLKFEEIFHSVQEVEGWRDNSSELRSEGKGGDSADERGRCQREMPGHCAGACA